MTEIQKIDNNRKTDWDGRLRDYGPELTSESALLEEQECILPYYAFVIVDEKSGKSQVMFFGHDDLPYWPGENGPELYDIEPQYQEEVLARIRKFSDDKETRCGIDGYIQPLKECANFELWEDLNRYMHNLMYWESVTNAAQNGPLSQRIAWLSQNVYELQKELKECKDSSPVIELIEKSLGEWTSADTPLDKDSIRELVSQYIAQIDREKRSYNESKRRQKELEKQIQGLQKELQEERTLTEYRTRFSNTIWEQIKQWFDVQDSNPQVIPANSSK